MIGLPYLHFLSPYALFVHWRRCNNSSRILLSYFILWHDRKAQNAFKFNFAIFNMDAIIFQVVSNVKLASFAFDFKLSQLRGVLDTDQ